MYLFLNIFIDNKSMIAGGEVSLLKMVMKTEENFQKTIMVF